MTPRTMALAVEDENGRVRYLQGETAEPWADVLERNGEKVASGAIITVAKVRDVGDRELHRVDTIWPVAGNFIPIKYSEWYLVGVASAPSERDPDEWRDTVGDR